jgi:hypothetical protein
MSPGATDGAVVAWRAKQITAHHIDAVATKVNLRHTMRLLKSAGVAEVAAVPDDPMLTERRLDIVHIVYLQPTRPPDWSSSAPWPRMSSGLRSSVVRFSGLTQPRFAGLAAAAHFERGLELARGRGLHAGEPMVCTTHRWRRESRANPSLQPRFPGYWEKYRETHSNSDASPYGRAINQRFTL